MQVSSQRGDVHRTHSKRRWSKTRSGNNTGYQRNAGNNRQKGVQRLLGTINYLAKFVPNMSAVTEPIRKLLKEEHEFIWTHEQQQAFEKLKDIITKNPVLSFYDVSKPVTHNPKGKWDQGTVVRNNNTPNSYVIETPEGQIFKRNRKHLLKTKEDKIEQTSLEEANENNHNDFDNITDEQSLEPSFVRRSERSVKNLLD
ncbi:unnamed protein product [Mytilus coruscus]|uniref:Reverse transcriptase/retrotransposon-derived protein RNase H-like domain-containing protein n=1 Tax=Mytilus coruscus TaxID=42192 RepID=A0A6J8A278_MYTCO|nr:unnamed protein product [Mytilus coruscus]